ncbi:MAG TPA: S8 family serine peptidase [Acidimicrobiales bacterium]|nr:S8 family serine peptidase [Acidimicrobiales bacterium]
MRSAPGVRALATLSAAVAAALVVGAPALAQSSPQWNIERVGAPASAAGVLIAVVDTGVDASHPALAGRVEPAIDLVGGTGGDPNGHGTHVAGTAAGADAGCGNIGVAPDARVLPVRVLDANGDGNASVVADGIRRAADHQPTPAVINLSLGADVVVRNLGESGLEEAIEYAWAKGAIPVLAAGNTQLVGSLFSSGYGDVPAVVVTATDNRDRSPSYANGVGTARWGIAAPGGDGSSEEGRDILSAFPGRRCALNAGTSMAVPHVSGALAALRASGLGPRAAVDRLLSTARDLGSQGEDSTFGFGLLDMRAALGRPDPPVVEPPTPDPAPTTTVAASGSVTRPSPRAVDPSTPPTTSAPATDGDDERATATASGDGERTSSPGGASTSTSTRPPAPGGDGDGADTPDESAASTVTEDDAGVPAGAVVAAVAALGAVGAASGVAARRLGRTR